MSDVVVVGGGLAGLVAARHLAVDGLAVDVIERRDRPGGRVHSRRVDGFTIDRGFQVLFTAYPAARRELDYDALDLRSFRPGAVIARPGERSVLSDPLGDPRAAFESLCNREVPLSDKLRTLALRRDLAGGPDAFAGRDVSIREYLRGWGFTDRYVENFVAPFYGGITLDRSLSTSASVFEYTFRTMAAGRTVLPARGMGSIVEQLADRARSAGVGMETGTRVEGVEPVDGRVRITTDEGTREADAAVVATDPRAAADLTGVGTIPTAGVGCVAQYYGLPAGSALRTGKRIVLNAADAEPNTVVPLTEVVPEYAPGDRELLAATFLGESALDAEVDELAARTRGALAAWYPERSFERLETVATVRTPFAQFAQPPGFHDELPDVRAPDGRVYLAGEYTEWSSIQGAMASGRAAAVAVRTDL